MQSRVEVNVRRYAVPIALVVALIVTNPGKVELQKQLLSVPKSNWWSSITNLFGSNVRDMLGESMFYNLGVMSLSKAGVNAYHIGLGGVWIESSFWTSIPGWFLMLQLVWHLITSTQAMYHRWVEILISSLWFALLARRVDSLFRVEKYSSTFFLIGCLLTVAIANFVWYPTKLFKQSNTHPGSLLYGMGSASLVYLTMTQDQFRGGYIRWNSIDVELSQLCLLMVVVQLLLGHSLGFAGSVAGVVLYYLAVFEVLNEKHWY